MPDRWANPRLPLIRSTAPETAKMDAATYLQMTEITEEIAREIGFPAYHRAGIVRAQNDTLQAVAIPNGPQCKPTMKSKQVTTNSKIPQRNHRSGRPIERCIQPWVL